MQWRVENVPHDSLVQHSGEERDRVKEVPLVADNMGHRLKSPLIDRGRDRVESYGSWKKL